MNRCVISVVMLLTATPVIAHDVPSTYTRSPLQFVANKNPAGAGLTDAQIASGLKETLRISAQKAVTMLGRPGGYTNDKQAHIPLPDTLEKLKPKFAAAGISTAANDLEKQINQAAEAVAARAVNILVDEIVQLKNQDARGLLSGPPYAATEHLMSTATPQLTQAIKPLVNKGLNGSGASESFKLLTANLKLLPTPITVNLDLSDYVATKTLDGIFYYMAQEELNIRTNPAARTNPQLRAIFK